MYLLCFCVDQNILLPRGDLFFDHSTLKLVIQIYDFIVHYLTSCYVQLFIIFLQFDSNLETEANPLAGLWQCIKIINTESLWNIHLTYNIFYYIILLTILKQL